MKEIDDEINLTLSLMQPDIYEGSLNELQYHLVRLLEIKRDRLVTETGLQAELERERERRFEGNRIASAEHRADVKALAEALEAALMVMTSREVRLEKQADAITMSRAALAAHRKLCDAQKIDESALAQYRKEYAKGGEK